MKRPLRVQRLARREEKATVKRIVWLSLVSLILAVSLFTLGIPALAKFADVLDRIFPKSAQDTGDSSGTPQPPNVDNLPSATNSAKLKISGFAPGASRVDIYLKSEKVGEATVKDNKFQFEDLILEKGDNNILGKSISSSGGESEFSQQQNVIYDNEEPKLEIETPSESQSFSGNNRILVSGKVDTDVQVYANGFLANINSDGKFEVLVPVPEGEITIEIKAVDDAGNTRVEKRKINYKK